MRQDREKETIKQCAEMKTYKSREQILRDIDSAHRKIAKAKNIAQEHLDAEELMRGTAFLSELRLEREAADKQLRKIKRLETIRLPKLGEKLAEFDTLLLIPPTHTGPETASEPSSPPPASAVV